MGVKREAKTEKKETKDAVTRFPPRDKEMEEEIVSNRSGT